ncbi:hypothetical protein ACFZBU_37945 [Embleya sp. NPDC008237]|uniref:hypothetical protein n=1 Tax=Embleya sp. NPDC008237 TaxID=3363978 RepID=UPI0036EA8C91
MNNPPDTEASTPPGTEEQLCEALEILAAGIHPAPDAYRTAHGDWQRRERRRRLILAGLIVLVFTLATVIGVLVLNHAPADAGPTFEHPPAP